jgi:predicted Zn-dependent protease
MLGAQLVTTKYGRSAELESDLYGMKYMYKAGYNPKAAIDLQQTFVRLSQGSEKNWIDGLFASHPPSQERVARNTQTAERLGGSNLEYGKERYRQAMAPLLKDSKAYAAADDALKAAKEKDFPKALKLIDRAIKLQPREPKFYGLRGDLSLNDKKFGDAVKSYDKAIALYPDYFAFHLQQGYAKRELGDMNGAIKALKISNQLLPTPNAQKALGDLALNGGDRALALQYYGSASGSNSAIGQAATVSIAELELEKSPNKYIKTRVGLNSQGRVAVLVHNASPLAVQGIEVVVAYFDERGNQVSDTKTLKLEGSLAANAQGTITTGLSSGQALRAAVTRAVIIR